MKTFIPIGHPHQEPHQRIEMSWMYAFPAAQFIYTDVHWVMTQNKYMTYLLAHFFYYLEDNQRIKYKSQIETLYVFYVCTTTTIRQTVI